VSTLYVINRKQTPYRHVLPRYQSPVLRNARPPLRDPTALGDALARKVLIKCKGGLKNL
jgi:hypothetical protein